MARKGFRPNRKGYVEVLNGPDAFDVCDRIASSMASRLGSGYTHDTMKGKRRVHAQVKTTIGGWHKENQTHLLRDTFPGNP